MQRRRDAWKEPRYFTVGSVGKDRELLPAINGLLPGNKDEKFSESSLLKASKEIIVYKQDNGLYGASIITAAICADRKSLAFYHFLDAIDMDEDDLIKTLALCEIYEVPVFPDTIDIVPELENLFKRLYTSGFKAPMNGGKPKRLMLVKSIGGTPLTKIAVSRDNATPRLVQPVIALSNQLRIDRFRELLWHTGRFLEGFGQGITALEEALEQDDVPERDIQVILEAYPEIFGLNYKRIESQFRFAERFVADFAFFTGEGSTVFVEIEAPHRKLFTRAGDQSAALTHAIGQVTSWHQWIAQNALYARERIPNVESPYSLIIIGRDSFLTEESRKTLVWMNSVTRNQYKIITYDEMLSEAKALFAKLTGTNAVRGYVESWIGANQD